MENKPNCILIHGCYGTKAESTILEYNKQHWIPYIKKELTLKGINTETPEMPAPWEPDYDAFKKEFEKYPVTENTILVGHSCGCAFLVRWLGESKQKIKKLILVAPWKIFSDNDPIREKFYNYEIDKDINSRVQEIVIFTSDNEREEGKKSLEIYREGLEAKIIELKNKGHYTLKDMGTNEFPELLQEILN